MKIGVLASGSGTNLQAIIDACKTGYIPNSNVEIVISNKNNSYSLERAKNNGILSLFLEPPSFIKFKRGMKIEDIMNDSLRREYDHKIMYELKKRDVEILCLAGYMLFVTPVILDEFTAINIHPAILPSFKGLHGIPDALNYGVKVIGCTTHFVDDKEDHGPIILQASTPVLPSEPLGNLSERNLKREYLIFAETLRLYKKKLLNLNGRKVEILWDEEHFNFHYRLLELWRKDINDYHNSRKQK
ncbi:MAG: phosphoribosylglycinamide formyltransferase [Promethearchaeota archaeon]